MDLFINLDVSDLFQATITIFPKISHSHFVPNHSILLLSQSIPIWPGSLPHQLIHHDGHYGHIMSTSYHFWFQGRSETYKGSFKPDKLGNIFWRGREKFLEQSFHLILKFGGGTSRTICPGSTCQRTICPKNHHYLLPVTTCHWRQYTRDTQGSRFCVCLRPWLSEH